MPRYSRAREVKSYGDLQRVYEGSLIPLLVCCRLCHEYFLREIPIGAPGRMKNARTV
jgi:hypothetical protein